jgi:hypothetical protein
MLYDKCWAGLACVELEDFAKTIMKISNEAESEREVNVREEKHNQEVKGRNEKKGLIADGNARLSKQN